MVAKPSIDHIKSINQDSNYTIMHLVKPERKLSSKQCISQKVKGHMMLILKATIKGLSMFQGSTNSKYHLKRDFFLNVAQGNK